MTKRIDIREFRELGLLQEVNRLFFHPRGLALEVWEESDGSMSLGGIWDARDDPEGVLYVADPDGGGMSDESIRERAVYAAESLERHRVAREVFGCVDGVQQLEVPLLTVDEFRDVKAATGGE